MIEVVVAGLGLAAPTSAPMLLLKERQGERVVPISIGVVEAQAIAMPLQGVRPPRPLTHDVFTNVIATLGGHLRRVEVTELSDSGTFHARLVLDQAGSERTVDIRPSDAVALAVRLETPIFVAESVLDAVGIVPEEALGASSETPAEEETVEVDESKLTPFKEFIETLDIDDLGKPGPESRQ